MKIKSYQVGGVVYSPFGPSQQVQQTTSSSDSASKAEKISGTMKEEVIKILKENGIPSDVDAFLNKANSFLNSSTALSSKSLFGGTDDDYDLSDLITIQKMANDVRWNKGLYDNAVKNLDSEDAWGEVALDSRGWMYVYEDGTIKTVNPDKFDSSKQVALTNEEMIGYREKSGKYAMNSNVLTNIGGTIGMKTIQDYILGLVEKLGTSTIQGYASKEQTEIANGIKALMAAGPDGYYKISDKQQGRDIQSALQYLHSQLTQPMRRVLEATIAAEGGNPSKDKYAFIGSILTQHVDFEQKADFDATATKHELEQSGQDKSSSGMVEQTLPERYASGNGFGAPEWMPIMTNQQNTPMYVQVQNLGSVLQKDGKLPLGDANVELLLNEAHGIGPIVDRSSITFGDISISWDDASKLMYEGDGNLYRVHMPVKQDSSGRLRPDFELQQTIDTINDQIEGMTPGQIKSAISDIRGVKYNEQTGLVEATNTHAFLTFSAVASDDTLGNNLKKSQYLHELSNEEDRKKKSRYNDAISIRSSIDGGSKNNKSNNPRTTWFFGYNFYEGNVWIPINDSIISASIYNNQRVSKDNYTNMSAKAQARQEYMQKQATTDQLIQSGNLRTTF